MEPEKIIGWADTISKEGFDERPSYQNTAEAKCHWPLGNESDVEDCEWNDNPSTTQFGYSSTIFQAAFTDVDVNADTEDAEVTENPAECLPIDSAQESENERTPMVIADPVAPSSAEQPSYQKKIISAILDLNPQDTYYGYEEVYPDITDFDVHRIEFEIQHAERFESLDFYQLIQSAYKVKQKAVSALNADGETAKANTKSPHLDELIAHLESKYKESFE